MSNKNSFASHVEKIEKLKLIHAHVGNATTEAAEFLHIHYRDFVDGKKIPEIELTNKERSQLEMAVSNDFSSPAKTIPRMIGKYIASTATVMHLFSLHPGYALASLFISRQMPTFGFKTELEKQKGIFFTKKALLSSINKAAPNGRKNKEKYFQEAIRYLYEVGKTHTQHAMDFSEIADLLRDRRK